MANIILMNFFKEKHLQAYSDPKSSFLEQQLADYQQRLQRAQDQMQSFKQKYRVFSLEEQRNLLLRQRSELDTAYKGAVHQVSEIRERQAALRRQMRDVPQDVPLYTETAERYKSLDDAKMQLLTLQLKEQELLHKYKETNPLVANVRLEIRITQDFIQRQEEAIKDRVRTGLRWGQRYLWQLREEESQGQQGGPSNAGEPNAVPNRPPWRAPLRRRDPDDGPLRRERPLGSLQGEIECRAQRQDPREAEQEPPPTDIACPSLKGRPGFTLGLARDGDFPWQTKPGGTHQTRGDQQDREVLALVGKDPGEGQTVGNSASIAWPRLPDPGQLRLHLEGALLPPEADAERGAGWDALCQIHTRAPLTQVAGPAYLVCRELGRFSLEQEGQLNRVSPEVALHGEISHGSPLRTSRMRRYHRP